MSVWTVALACVSCTKDDATLSDSTLVGKWMAVELKVEYLQDGKVLGSETDNCVNYSRLFQFNADGTGQDIEKEGNSSQTYAIKSWVLMGDELILTYENYDNENYKASYDSGYLYLVLTQVDEESNLTYRLTYKFEKK